MIIVKPKLKDLRLFFNLFKKNSFAQLESFYLEEGSLHALEQFPWMALAINQRTLSESVLTKELVLTPKAEVSGISLQMAEVKHGLVHHVYHGKKCIYSSEMKHADEIKNTRVLFNNLLDSFIQKEIKHFADSMNKSEFSPLQKDAEEKALEWIRVSFEILTKAIIESLTNPDYLFQTKLFMGINPSTSKHEIRLITFNLDMTLILLDDNNLRAIIYNVKPGEEIKNLKPALSGDYSLRKREMFDHFIKLLSALSKGLHA